MNNATAGIIYDNVSAGVGHGIEASEVFFSLMGELDFQKIYDITLGTFGQFVAGAGLTRFAADTIKKVCFTAYAIWAGVPVWRDSPSYVFDIMSSGFGYACGAVKSVVNSAIVWPTVIRLGVFLGPLCALVAGLEIAENTVSIVGSVLNMDDGEGSPMKKALLLVLKTAAAVCTVASVIMAFVSTMPIALTFAAIALACKIAHDLYDKLSEGVKKIEVVDKNATVV